MLNDVPLCAEGHLFLNAYLVATFKSSTMRKLLLLLLLLRLSVACQPVFSTSAETSSHLDSLLLVALKAPVEKRIPLLYRSLAVSRAKQLDRLELKTLEQLAKSYHRSQDKDSLAKINRDYFNKALAMRDTLQVAKAHFSLGAMYFNSTEYTPAYTHFNSARMLFSMRQDSLEVGKSLLNLAIVESAVGDFYTSEATALEALNYFQSPQAIKYRQRVFNSLAINSSHLNEHIQALQWFQESQTITKHLKNKMIIKNNMGLVSSINKDYAKALIYFDSVLTHPQIGEYPRVYSMSLNNKGYTLFLQGDARALPLLKQAYAMRIAGEFSGEASSLWHLGEYYRLKNEDSARYYLEQAVALCRKTRNIEMERKSLLALSKMSDAAPYKLLLERLEDSLQKNRIGVKYRFAHLRHKLQDQEQSNTWLIKIFKQEQQKVESLHWQRFFLIVFIITLIPLFVLGLSWGLSRFKTYHMGRKKKIAKAKQRLRNNIALYLHDHVNGILFNAMNQGKLLAEEQPSLLVQTIVDNIKKAQKKIGEISKKQSKHLSGIYTIEERLGFTHEDFNIRNKMAFELVKKEAVDWSRFSMEELETLFWACSEALKNIHKHGQATKIKVVITQNAKQTSIEIEDNGIGFPRKVNYGVGLVGMRERVESIGGRIYYTSKKGIGTKIQIILK